MHRLCIILLYIYRATQTDDAHTTQHISNHNAKALDDDVKLKRAANLKKYLADAKDELVDVASEVLFDEFNEYENEPDRFVLLVLCFLQAIEYEEVIFYDSRKKNMYRDYVTLCVFSSLTETMHVFEGAEGNMSAFADVDYVEMNRAQYCKLERTVLTYMEKLAVSVGLEHMVEYGRDKSLISKDDVWKLYTHICEKHEC